MSVMKVGLQMIVRFLNLNVLMFLMMENVYKVAREENMLTQIKFVNKIVLVGIFKMEIIVLNVILHVLNVKDLVNINVQLVNF